MVGMKQGFHEFIDPTVIGQFSSQQLELLLCGVAKIDIAVPHGRRTAVCCVIHCFEWILLLLLCVL